LFVVASEGSQELRIKAGYKIAESQVLSLGKVLVGLRPPNPASEDQGVKNSKKILSTVSEIPALN
jgi:hypothetical protein